MVLMTRPRQEDIKHHLPDSAAVSIVRGDRLLRLRTICETREEAERTFLLFTFTYGLGAARPLRVGEAPGGAVWEASVTAVGRDARVCMSCDRYVPIFDRCVDANNICMSCMLAGRGPQTPPVPYATPRGRFAPLSAAPALPSPTPALPGTTIAALVVAAAEPDDDPRPAANRSRRRGGRRHARGRVDVATGVVA